MVKWEPSLGNTSLGCMKQGRASGLNFQASATNVHHHYKCKKIDGKEKLKNEKIKVRYIKPVARYLSQFLHEITCKNHSISVIFLIVSPQVPFNIHKKKVEKVILLKIWKLLQFVHTTINSRQKLKQKPLPPISSPLLLPLKIQRKLS